MVLLQRARESRRSVRRFRPNPRRRILSLNVLRSPRLGQWHSGRIVEDFI
jgi:hypothetical protein